jgi:hypothetical protein
MIDASDALRRYRCAAASSIYLQVLVRDIGTDIGEVEPPRVVGASLTRSGEPGRQELTATEWEMRCRYRILGREARKDAKS